MMRSPRAALIALLTDFGTRDWYVAAVKGAILSRCPRAHLIDITHGIPPQDILAGAFTLAAASPWFPRGTIFVAVVDPGVGTDRALLAAQADGRYFIGPDNGLLALSLERAGRVSIVRLTNRRYWLPHISQTFQGRDIMAPVAAYLACGGSLRQLGPPVRRVAPLTMPQVHQEGRTVRGCIVHIDAFGNLVTNLPARFLSPPAQAIQLRHRRGAPRASSWPHQTPHWVGRHPAHPHEQARPTGPTAKAVARWRGRRIRVVSSYSDGASRELVAVAGSLGLVELAIRNGSAARTLKARRGERVTIKYPAHGRGIL